MLLSDACQAVANELLTSDSCDDTAFVKLWLEPYSTSKSADTHCVIPRSMRPPALVPPHEEMALVRIGSRGVIVVLVAVPTVALNSAVPSPKNHDGTWRL